MRAPSLSSVAILLALTGLARAQSGIHPVDHILAAGVAQHGIAWPPPVSDARFARRVYFDLWGLPPTPAELRAFRRDPDPGKRSRLIDSLLANSERYAQHWISWWNDLLRNETGVNYQGDRKSITPWLLAALERNLPYDKMVAALVDPAAAGDPDGFLIGVNWRGAVSASQAPYMQAAQNTAQLFLGINLKCASCHDSFINRYKLRQSYGMAALFSRENRLELYRCDVRTGQFTGPQLLYPELGSVPEDATLPERHAAAARFFTDPRNVRVSRTIVNRYWQKLFGRGLVEPVDEMDNTSWNPELLDWLAADFTAHGSDLKYLLRLLMTSQAYQLPAVPAAGQPPTPYVFRGPQVRRLTAEQFADTVSAVTGEWRAFEASEQCPEAAPARDWQFKASPLDLALGRPLRDQVFTTRDNRAATFQALELANGASLENTLQRGALRLLGQLAPPPDNLFDSGIIHKGSATFDINICGAHQLWLIEEDAGSYDSTRTLAGWKDVELTGPKGTRKLADSSAPPGARRLLNIQHRGYSRMRGSVYLDNRSRADDIDGAVRFFVFAANPDPERLVRTIGEPPVPAPPRLASVHQAIDRLYLALLAREPNPEETRIARSYFGARMTPAALEDFLWSLLLHPEFQYLY